MFYSRIQFEGCGSGGIQGGQLGGHIEAKIGTKRANFARFWSILEEAAPPRSPSGSATVDNLWVMSSFCYCEFILRFASCFCELWVHFEFYLFISQIQSEWINKICEVSQLQWPSHHDCWWLKFVYNLEQEKYNSDILLWFAAMKNNTPWFIAGKDIKCQCSL